MPLQLHFAVLDDCINKVWLTCEAAFRAVGKNDSLPVVGFQHGFTNDTTPRFDPKAANLAWERTMAFVVRPWRFRPDRYLIGNNVMSLYKFRNSKIGLFAIFIWWGCGNIPAQSLLPECPQSGYFDNCFGILVYANRDKYVGEWKDDKRNGQGIATFSNGDKYFGEWKDNRRSGQGNYNYANGTKYSGGWKDDRRSGQGMYTFANGNKYIGEWKDGERSGQGTYTFANGDQFVGEHKDGDINGQGTFTSVGGSYYFGEWRDGERHGQGTSVSANGEKYVGEWRGDKRNGQGTFRFAGGNTYVGEWKDNKRNGQGTLYRPNGSVINSGIWTDDRFIRSADVRQAHVEVDLKQGKQWLWNASSMPSTKSESNYTVAGKAP